MSRNIRRPKSKGATLKKDKSAWALRNMARMIREVAEKDGDTPVADLSLDEIVTSLKFDYAKATVAAIETTVRAVN